MHHLPAFLCRHAVAVWVAFIAAVAFLADLVGGRI
jgi:hypothetical protein